MMLRSPRARLMAFGAAAPRIICAGTLLAVASLGFEGDARMLNWAIAFLVIALIAAFLGFGGIAGAATGIAKILFVVFLVAFVVSLLMGRRGRGSVIP